VVKNSIPYTMYFETAENDPELPIPARFRATKHEYCEEGGYVL